jgi:glutathione S-transferase
MHPLSSFCHKVLIALYENSIPFESHVVNLADPVAREEFRRLWPLARFPVIRDTARSQTVPESTLIIEYLTLHYPGPSSLLPNDPELALQVRARDRFYDLLVHEPLQKIVGDKLRAPGAHDPTGVEAAREKMRAALRIVDEEMATRQWAVGAQFSMADCAAAPPLFFINIMTPLAGEFPHLAAYLERLKGRPSYARALAEAQPYLHMFPGHP